MNLSIKGKEKTLKLTATERRQLARAQEILDGISEVMGSESAKLASQNIEPFVAEGVMSNGKESHDDS